MFQLDDTLNKDCFILGKLELCLVLLMNDANYPWCILVPQQANISEIYQLSTSQQQQLTLESSLLSKALAGTFHADKMNIAALGNVVKQLHIHHVVRYENDIAWPGPIWGKHPAKTYSAEARQQVIEKITQALGEQLSLVNPHV